MSYLAKVLLAVGAFGWSVAAAAAQPPAEALALPATLRDSTGVPKAPAETRDRIANARGNQLQWESKPLLMPIGDSRNLESETPSLQAAAEIKAEEDLTEQKIKAIHYLAAVACASYPNVAGALPAGSDGWVEKARYEAAMALLSTPGDPYIPSDASWCSAEIIAKLDDVANGEDENGCPKEPSSRVRAAARTAVQTCRRRMADVSPDDVPGTDPKEGAQGAALTDSDDQGWIQLSDASQPAYAGESTRHVHPVSTLVGEAARVSGSQVDGDGGSDSEDRQADDVNDTPRLAAVQPVPPAVQPVPPAVQPVPAAVQPTPPEAARRPIEITSLFGSPEPAGELYRREVGPSPTSVEVAPKEVTNSISPSDVGALLRDSPTVQSAKAQRRSPVSLDPNIRGFKAGQVYSQAGGVFWTPARRDLDTMLSKIDPGMIQDVFIIPGPYGLRYGPGFAFIDVIREPTPRYGCGFEAHLRTRGDLHTNGGQLYGRQTVIGGSRDWGFRFSYGHRRGSDYEAGNDLHIPSSYENRDAWGELSYDVNPNQHIDIAYQRLDQTDTEYPGQFFDIGFLGTYGFELHITDDDPMAPWSMLSIDGWYNRTRFHGDTANKRNPDFPVMQRVEWALDDYFSLDPSDPDGLSSRLFGRTQGGVNSSGARIGVTFGDPDATQFRVGTDFRYLGQVIEEQFNVDFVNLGAEGQRPDDGELANFTTNMPHSWLRDPGFYAEWSSPIHERWRLSLGGRMDWIATRARAGDIREETNLTCGGSALNQNDVLYAFYLDNEFSLSRTWTLRAGFGHAQRPPTLVERYADGLFLGIVQSGFTRVVGNPTLNPERNWQFDVGLSTDNDCWRGRANFFHAWVLDYITLEDGTVTNFADARLVRFTNTDLATLTGFELAGELDLLPRVSAFGNLSYVDGRDRDLAAPLPAIPPLESTVGLRLHDSQKGRRWGIELGTRIVNDQDRLGTIRSFDRRVVLEERTPGFTVWHLRGYWNRTENLSLVAGIYNLFDKTYQEHLDLRLLGPAGFPGSATRVLSPGFTPYFGFDWVF